MKLIKLKFIINTFYILIVFLTNIRNSFSSVRGFESLERQLESGLSWGILLSKITIVILSLVFAYIWYNKGYPLRAVGTIIMGIIICEVMQFLS